MEMMFKTGSIGIDIRGYSIKSKTAKYLVYINEFGKESREAIETEYHKWHETHEDAVAWLKSQAKNRIEAQKNNLAFAEQKLAEIEAKYGDTNHIKRAIMATHAFQSLPEDRQAVLLSKCAALAEAAIAESNQTKRAIMATHAFQSLPQSGQHIVLNECVRLVKIGIDASKEKGFNTWAMSQKSEIVRDIVQEIYTYHKFPKVFETEGVNPYLVPVKVVVRDAHSEPIIFPSLFVMPIDTFVGMGEFHADKHEGFWCLRLEKEGLFDTLGNNK